MTLAILLLLGLVIGCVGTIIGAGGGFLLMPILLLWRPAEHADRLTALSLAMIFCNAVSGSVGYARLKRIDYRAGLTFAAAALPGAIIGAEVVEYLPRRGFDIAFAILMIVMGSFLLYRGEKRSAPASGAQPNNPQPPGAKPALGVGAAISVGVGFISSILGIGGGIVHVPALVHLARFPVHVATATSHFVLAITSAVAVIVLARKGMLDGQWDTAAALGLGAVIGAQAGANLAQRVRGAVIVRALGIALVLAAARVGWQALSR